MRPSGFFCVALIVVFNGVAVEPAQAQISSASIRATVYFRARRKAITAPSRTWRAAGQNCVAKIQRANMGWRIAYEFYPAASAGK
jgi:hypothetical protein